jgi:BatD DUF11 like domain
MYNLLMWKFIFSFIYLFLPFGCWAQGLLKASLSQSQTVLNQPVELRYKLENAKFVNFPAIKLADFDVMGPSTMMSQTVINGQVSSSEVYTFMLYPRRVGKFSIPALTVKTNTKQTLTAPALSLEVTKQVKNDKQQGEILLITEVSNRNPVKGEQLLIDLKLYTQVNLEGLKIARLPNSTNLLLQEMRGFDNDWKETNLNGKKYFAASIYRAVAFATQAGQFSIDGAMVQVGVLEDNPNNSFSSFAQIVPKVLNSEPVALEVENINDAPEFFKGAVGSYNMLAYVDKNNISTDDALRLFVRINGEGDIKQVFAPELMDKDTAFEVFEPTFNEEIAVTTRAVGGVKTFEFVLNPTKMGTFEVSPVFVYYNNELKRFVRKDTTFVINISQGKNPLAAKITRNTPAAKADTLKLLPAQTETVLTQNAKFSLFGSVYFYSGLGLIWLAFPLLRRYEQRKSSPVADAPINANLAAQKHLNNSRQLLTGGQNTPFYQAIEQGLQQYVADKLDLPLADISKNTIQNILAQKAVNQALINHFLQILDACYLAIYAGIYPNNSPAEIQQKAEMLIADLEKCL